MTSSFQNPEEHYKQRAVRRVLLLTLAVNVIVALLKLYFGYSANIVSLQADGFHSLFDGTSNIIGLLALGIALRPPDPEHPYGHHKIEVAASIIIGIMIILGLLEVGRGVWKSALGESTPEITVVSFVVVITTICASFMVSFFERRAGNKYDSMILTADADHSFSDALAGLAVLIGMTSVVLGFESGDVIAALAVMAFIGMTAYRVLKTGLDVLIDAALLDAEKIRRLVEEIPQVISCHYVRSRGMPGRVHLDLHLTLDPEMRLADAGEILLQVKAHLREELPELADILIQIEPHKPVHYQDVPQNLV